MEFRQLGGSGLKVPVLSFGPARSAAATSSSRRGAPPTSHEATRLVDVCLDAGRQHVRHGRRLLATALSEEILGEAIKGRRDKVLISTKATFRFGDGPNEVGSSRYHLIRAVDAALKRLGTDYIDLFQLHGFDARDAGRGDAATLDDLVRAGKVRYIGVLELLRLAPDEVAGGRRIATAGRATWRTRPTTR